MGCIYMDQRKRAAGRGYAYVAVSRFQSRAGCHWFGKLRRSDFLPVGEEKEDEVLERGFESESTAESDGIPEVACQGGGHLCVHGVHGRVGGRRRIVLWR